MFLIRLLLRLVLLLFLAICLFSAWHETDWATRLLLAFVSMLLVAGIYALKYLRSMEHSKYAKTNSSLVWQFFWSDKTPFFPKVSREPLVFEDASRSGSPPQLSPGLHIISARLIPMAISLLFMWVISMAITLYRVRINGTQQPVSGVGGSDLELLWYLAGVLVYLICYMLVQRMFIKRVPAICMTEGCRGQAFLGTEPDSYNTRNHQFVYICSQCNARHATGVMAWKKS